MEGIPEGNGVNVKHQYAMSTTFQTDCSAFFGKGLFTNSTQENMVSSEHSEMDKFIKQDCPNKNVQVLRSTHKERGDGNSFISSILPIEESTKVSTLYLFMCYLEQQYIIRRWGRRANSSLFHRVMAQGLV